jgi:hypothetical protein
MDGVNVIVGVEVSDGIVCVGVSTGVRLAAGDADGPAAVVGGKVVASTSIWLAVHAGSNVSAARLLQPANIKYDSMISQTAALDHPLTLETCLDNPKNLAFFRVSFIDILQCGSQISLLFNAPIMTQPAMFVDVTEVPAWRGML